MRKGRVRPSVMVGIGDLERVPYAPGYSIVRCAKCGFPSYLNTSDIVRHKCTKKMGFMTAFPVFLNEHRFDSLSEARRFAKLVFLKQKGIIKDLVLQPTYVFTYNGVKICEYRADFAYTFDGSPIVEDVKGVETPVFRLKMSLMRAFYPTVNVILVKV